MKKAEAIAWLRQLAKEFAVRLEPFAAEAGIKVLNPEVEWDDSVDGCWADAAVVSSRRPRLLIDLWLDRWAADRLQLAYGVGCRQVEPVLTMGVGSAPLHLSIHPTLTLYP